MIIIDILNPENNQQEEKKQQRKENRIEPKMDRRRQTVLQKISIDGSIITE